MAITFSGKGDLREGDRERQGWADKTKEEKRNNERKKEKNRENRFCRKAVSRPPPFPRLVIAGLVENIANRQTKSWQRRSLRIGRDDANHQCQDCRPGRFSLDKTTLQPYWPRNFQPVRPLGAIEIVKVEKDRRGGVRVWHHGEFTVALWC